MTCLELKGNFHGGKFIQHGKIISAKLDHDQLRDHDGLRTSAPLIIINNNNHLFQMIVHIC